MFKITHVLGIGILQENNNFTFFLYNNTGANSSEWFKPAEDEGYKRTIALQDRKGSKARVKVDPRTRSHATNAGRSGGRGATGVGGRSGTGGGVRGGGRGGTGGGRGGTAHGSSSGAGASGSSGLGSRCRSLPSDPGYIYIIQMSGSYNGHYQAPPFAKVGFTNNCQQRLGNLKAGNPYKLTCYKTYHVCNKDAAETAAHNSISSYRVQMGGGTEWFYYTSLSSLATTVRNAIAAFIDQPGSDFVELSKNPCLTPNPAGVIIATNYGHLNPRFAGVYNQRWRQAIQGNVLHIKYNCK